ncbi:MAG TPA: protein kinase [Gammaproteobacteria bacterium]
MNDITNTIVAFLKNPDRYSRLRELGAGSIGKVHAVFDTFLQRVVAHKVMKQEHLANNNILQTFGNEIKLMGRLSHPGILPVYDAMLGDNGEPAYIMRYAEGEDLAALLQMPKGKLDSVALPLEQAVRILLKLCETLAYAHDHGVLHLDLKPENIMLGRYGEVLIMDWGAARVYDTVKYEASIKQHTGDSVHIEHQHENRNLLIGTPAYMSPEQLKSPRDQLTPASDIFSIGTLFYQMITGVHPFKERVFEKLSDKIARYTPPPAHEVNADIPHNISRICEGMLQKKPEERYASFREIIKDIDDYQRSGAGSPTRNYAAGEIIFKEGDPSDFVCIVVSGSVEISVRNNGKTKAIARLGANEPFGELAALTGNPRTATATAVEASVIRMISKQDIAVEIENLSPWVGSMVKALSKRFIDNSERLLKLEKNARPGLLDKLKNLFNK